MKGKETTIKLKLKPNTQSIDLDYILDSMLNLTNKDKKKDLTGPAKQIINWASRRGDEGLQSAEWSENAQKLDLTQSQYFHIIKTLKKAGIIYKSKGRFYLSKTFANHMANIAKTMNNTLIDLGAL